MDIGKKIKSLRENLGMSQNELAKKANIAQSSLSYIESGGKSPSIETLECICRGLGISLQELIGKQEAKKEIQAKNDETHNELIEIFETIRERPEIKTLFDLSAKSTKEMGVERGKKKRRNSRRRKRIYRICRYKNK